MPDDSEEPIDVRILKKPWHNAYWFSRMLINSDQYAGLGKDSKKMIEIAGTIRAAYDNVPESEKKLEFLKNALKNALTKGLKDNTKKKRLVANLANDVFKKIETVDDIEVFVFTCENILARPYNNNTSEWLFSHLQN